jgi:predicted phosphoribosyltransferase
MFRNRQAAAHQLVQKLRGHALRDPVVLGVPPGGIVVGAVLARELGADFDVVFVHKLCAPGQPDVAVGAVSEDGQVSLNRHAAEVYGLTEEYLAAERRRQLDALARWRGLVRRVLPPASIAGRSVIVTDDGIATGSTMLAALDWVRAQAPASLTVAVPTALPEQVAEIRRRCDPLVYLHAPDMFLGMEQFYEDAAPVTDAEVRELLEDFTRPTPAEVSKAQAAITRTGHATS